MGFLKVFGRALLWDESKPHQKTVKDNAVKVIINAIKAEKQCRPQFGYEFEFHKIIIDDQAKKVYLDLSGQDDIIKSSTYNLQTPFHLSHEYGGWMLEVIHDNPFQFNNVSALIGSVNHCYNYLNEKNPKTLKICVLLDKKERRVKPIKVDYTGFEIDNKFVLGYGLDYDEKYRNLEYIGIVL